MGDRRRRSMAMQMTRYQARMQIEDVELFNAEVELINSFMQSEHHGESSHCGFVTKRSYVQRDREECHDRMMKDYFIERPRFPAHDFRRRFRMRRELFESILNAVVNHDHYFEWRVDAAGRQGLSPHQKFTSAFRMLVNECSADSTDEYCRLAESTAIENLKRFCKASEFRYKVNGNKYELGYYLTDGIYPSWSTFVKSFSHPDSAKKKLFSQRQKSYRKDVERAFGILQARWAIVRGPARFWQSEYLHSIMMTCTILHNMIVEDEYIEIEEDSDEDVDDDQPTYVRVIARDVEYLAPTTYETRQYRVTLSEYMRRLNRIQAPQCHDTLCKDLVEHVRRREGER
ncbi:uncharacterized protein [Pyrus communis]|uniref:uncharacterized protein n=1 Tax=Pyrus communis TaxID=23211 RepID=UPI0035C2312D